MCPFYGAFSSFNAREYKGQYRNINCNTISCSDVSVQLIYAVSEDGTEGEIGVIFTKRATFLEEDCEMLRKMGVKIPSTVYVMSVCNQIVATAFNPTSLILGQTCFLMSIWRNALHNRCAYLRTSVTNSLKSRSIFLPMTIP